MTVAHDHPLQHWHPVLPQHDLRRKPVECRLFGHEIVLYRADDGQAHALDNRCPHRRMRLALGRVAGDRIVCPYHGWSFGPDGSGASPATPRLRVRTGCYDVTEHHGMVWLRAEGGRGEMPALQFEGYRPIACLQHRLAAPLSLLLDNMTELEHSATVHSVFGFELERLHEVRTDARQVADGIDIDYEGPQRRLPAYLQWATGIAGGDRFVQRAQVRNTPLRATYDLEWFDSDSGRRRPLSLKFVIHFDETGTDAAAQTTFVFARADTAWARQVLRCFSFVLRHHIDRELRADIQLVESLRLESDAATTGTLGRFDRPLVMRRRALGDAMPLAGVRPLRVGG
jgi:phenylpropionate dioxygenase-like ring-hydroxylating dioxygenase large terminal subunit